MSFVSKTYRFLPTLAAFSSLLAFAPTPVAAQSPTLRSPTDVRGFYTTLYGNPFGNATGNFTFIVWKGDSSEADPLWGGYRVRRTIDGVSVQPFEVIGEWKARFIQGPICLAITSPCPGFPFQFTGTGLFFHGFQQNRQPDGSYIWDYPPGAPQDTCSNCWVYADGASLSGFRHQYAVTAIDTTVVITDPTATDFYETAIDSSEIVTLLPGSPPQTNLEQVAVVPNPYKVRAEWEPADGSRLVKFIRVPHNATVRIFTSAGELLRTLKSNQFASAGGLTGDVPWDLRNESGRGVVSGIYLYQIETEEGRTRKGKFVIIK
jgi:hypothetical protein